MPDIASEAAERIAQLSAALTDRYRIDREVGAGGMARVYLAEDLRFGRRVAVKVLRPELGATVAVDRFRREIEIAATLNHPLIVPLLDGAVTDDLVYYVMPYLEGEALSDRLTAGPLTVPEATAYLRDIIEALEYAHGKGVVHRDIKPGNVLLSGRHALVTDFGIAKALAPVSGDPALTTTGMVVGTPTYMAPEQISGNDPVDHRADLYSVGVLGYELLTGKPPFRSKTSAGMLAAHAVERPEPVTKRTAAVPKPLEAVIMRCLEKDPARRWQSAREMLLALDGGPIPALGHPIGRWLTRPVRRAIAVAAGVVALAVMLVVFPWRGRAPSPAEPHRIVVLPFELKTADPALDGAGSLLAEWITQGLHREEIGQAVPSGTVSQFLESSSKESDPARALADFTKAQIVISGSVYRERDTLVIGAQLAEAAGNRLIGTIDPVRAATLTEGAELVRQRVVGLAASYLGFGERARMQTPPPSIEVYREFIAGRDAFYRRDFAGALTRFQRVTTMDSTYVSHIPVWGAALFWLGRWPEAESLLVSALGPASRFTPFEHASAEYVLAWLQGDVETEYRMAAEREKLDPSLAYNLATSAIRANRPESALAAYRTVDLTSSFAGRWQALWAMPAMASHMLGAHDRELEFARAARLKYPDELWAFNLEVAALAALGRSGQLREFLDRSPAVRGAQEIPPEDKHGWSVILAGLELRAHDHEAEAGPLIAEARAWYRREPPNAPDSLSLRFGGAFADYLAGNYDSARTALASLLAGDHGNPDYLGMLGVIAVRTHDAPAAARIRGQLEALDPKYQYGRPTRWLARMAALEGDRARALTLLQNAYQAGISLGFGQDWIWLHLDPDLRDLRGFPPFETWRAPK